MVLLANRPLADYVAFEYLLLGDLRELLMDPPGPDTRKWVVLVLDELLDTLHCEFSLEEEGGYLSEVVEAYPNWSGQVDELHDEHQTLFADLLKLRQRIARDGLAGNVAQRLLVPLHEWMAKLTAHQRHERRLVQAAFNLDIGSAD